MDITFRSLRLSSVVATAALALASASAMAADVKVTLTGAQETPAVTTSATGSGTITVNADKTVTGSIKTTGIEGVAAHIHTGAVGVAGPPIIPLTKGADGTTWTVKDGAKLTDEQYEAFKAGNLYVNVHSAANKGGEIRGQLKP